MRFIGGLTGGAIAVAVGRLPFPLPRQRPHHLLLRRVRGITTQRGKNQSNLWKRTEETEARMYVQLYIADVAIAARARVYPTYRCPWWRRRGVRAVAGERGEGADVEGDEPAAADCSRAGAGVQVRLAKIARRKNRLVGGGVAHAASDDSFASSLLLYPGLRLVRWEVVIGTMEYYQNEEPEGKALPLCSF
jgi:hypothetical protein